MSMTSDIFIKTCEYDAAYHKYCLQSIEKYTSGFRQTVVVEGEHPRGYLHQQVIKMHAYEYTDADFICITDSDTLFCRQVTPETYMVDGKPLWLHTPWTDDMRACKGLSTWAQVMRDFLGEEPPSEFMRRQPFFIPRWLLQEIAEYCQGKFGMSLKDYIMSIDAFSEYNIIGFYAWLYHHDKFQWIDTSVDPLPQETVVQFWSHDPIEKNIPHINRVLHEI
jgi:hypothetical protein